MLIADRLWFSGLYSTVEIRNELLR